MLSQFVRFTRLFWISIRAEVRVSFRSWSSDIIEFSNFFSNFLQPMSGAEVLRIIADKTDFCGTPKVDWCSTLLQGIVYVKCHSIDEKFIFLLMHFDKVDLVYDILK